MLRRAFSTASPATTSTFSCAPVFQATRRAFTSAFAGVVAGPADPILGLSTEFQKDQDKSKVNLGVGVYRGDDGKPFVLECVREAERRLVGLNLDMEYAAITGVPKFVTAAQQLAFGVDNTALKEKRLASAQVLSGTGALRTGMEFLERWYTPSKTVMMPTPSWPNHANIVRDSNLQQGKYTYFNPATNGLNYDGMVADINAALPGSIVLVHACAHNPTGIDPTPDQWMGIIDAIKKRNHFPLIDMAYQGFASGDPERDAFALRALSDAVPNLIVCQSFAKSFGLYGHRCGALTIQCSDAAECERVLSQLKIMIRPMYSNPPVHGARIVDIVLSDEQLTAMWRQELLDMSGRMTGMRTKLVECLKAEGSTKDWSHLVSQIGMMAYTGLNKAQVDRLKKEFHIYMTADGRAAITGLNNKNVTHVAKAFHAVTSS